jgi:drug/metabolite transporter (DMT)-like permease
VQHNQPSVTNKRQLLIGSSFVLIAALGFSAKAVIIKLVYQESQQVDAITLMSLRMVLALPVFLLVAFWQGDKNQGNALRGKDWMAILILGAVGYYWSSLLDFTGLQFISASLERVILFLYPTFVILFSAMIFRQPVSLRAMFALLISYSGMLVVFFENMQMDSVNVIKGSLLVFSSAISFALFLIGSGVMIKRIGSARFTAMSMTVACLATLVHFSISHDLKALNLPEEIYVLAMLMAAFSTILPAFLMNAGIRRIGSGTASIISSTGPIGTLFLAWFFLQEAISWAQIGGTFLVLAGVYIASQAKS